MKVLLLSGLLLLAALATVPGASAGVDPCDQYGACVEAGGSGVFVGDCQKLTCAGVWVDGDGRVCYGFSYQVPQCYGGTN